jgi:hypothetical protein
MKKNVLFLIFLAIGIIFRLYSCFYTGHVGDMSQYMEWGSKTLMYGLSEGFKGIYYPFQFQIFELFSFISKETSIPTFIVFKLGNLPFDIGIMYLLTLILKRNKKSEYFALLYWLNPWFLNNFALGFVDTQYTFFVLLSIFLYKKNGNVRDFLISGLPLGLAVVLKPQVVMIFLAFSFTFLFYMLRDKKQYKCLYFFVPSVICFLAYELYFTVSLYPSVYIASRGMEIPSILYLPAHYINVKNINPNGLTCSMMNIWYPIADLLRDKNEPIYSISSKIELLPHLTISTLFLVTTILIILKYCHTKIKNAMAVTPLTLLNIVAFVGLFVPFFMTNAHYNHPYIGSVCLVPLVPFLSRKNQIFVCILYLVLFFNIFEFAGLGGLYPAVNRTSSIVVFCVSLIAIIAFVKVLVCLYKKSPGEEAGMYKLNS